MGLENCQQVGEYLWQLAEDGVRPSCVRVRAYALPIWSSGFLGLL